MELRQKINQESKSNITEHLNAPHPFHPHMMRLRRRNTSSRGTGGSISHSGSRKSELLVFVLIGCLKLYQKSLRCFYCALEGPGGERAVAVCILSGMGKPQGTESTGTGPAQNGGLPPPEST